MGRSLSKERARVLKGMGFKASHHQWVRNTCNAIGTLDSTAVITPKNGQWLAECDHLTWQNWQSRRQTFPDPITAAIWIEIELSQEAGV